jgi:hypothetical protein
MPMTQARQTPPIHPSPEYEAFACRGMPGFADGWFPSQCRPLCDPP